MQQAGCVGIFQIKTGKIKCAGRVSNEFSKSKQADKERGGKELSKLGKSQL